MSLFKSKHQPKVKKLNHRKRASSTGYLTFGRLEPRQLLAADVLISEFLSSNDSGLVDGNGNESDWIELFNAGDQAQDLAGWHLTDNGSDLGKWVFPNVAESVLAPGEYLVVFASGDGVADIAGNLHTNFRLSSSGEYLALTRPDTTVVSEFGANGTDYPAQFTDVSYGAGVSGAAFFQTPTPGEANGAEFSGVVGDTVFSVERGYYTSSFDVEITTSTTGATIYYTTDGSNPEPGNGFTYSSPITISSTTNLRAAAFLDGYIPTNIETQTYIFGSDVLTQSVAPAGFPSQFLPITADTIDYAVDPEIALDPIYTDRLLEGLQDIPTVSLTSTVDDIFGSNGIYTNPLDDTLEVPTSVEYILADGTTGFQIDAGLRISGGASRIPSRSPKHSFSLRFRQEYGQGRLEYELFEESLVTSFNSLQLRATYNNSLIHFNNNQRNNATLIRDQFVRDSLLAFGQDDAQHGEYTNLFINGLFWGVYNLHERGEAAHFSEYNGGEPDDYDALNGGVAIDGNLNSWNALRAAARNGTFEEVQERLDVDNFIDWVIIQEYVGNVDLQTGANWRAAGGGPNNAKWRIYAWDSERSLEGVSSGLPDTLTDATGLLDDLREFPEFILRMEDRIQKHYFNGGALTESAVTQRWQARVDELDLAIIGESARWGDYRRDFWNGNNQGGSADLYERDVHWVAENQRLLTQYFPARADIVLAEYESLGYFGNVDAPVFQIDGAIQSGGEVSAGSSLDIISAPGATAYYTTDGSDPRLPDGSVDPSAIAATPASSPVILDTSTNILARTFSNGEWSAVHDATFVIPAVQSDLRITEINYNPADPSVSEVAAGYTDNDDFEFIELYNSSTSGSINLEGVQLSNGVAFDFSDIDLLPGERVVVVEDVDAFMERYGDSATVLGQWSGGLSNGGERVTLLDSSANEILSIDYGDSDPWDSAADGLGFSLVLDDPVNTPVEELGKYYRWRASTELGGTPGTAATARTGVVINEILAHTDSPQSDSIELFNPTSSDINVGGWYLSDAGDDLLKFQIPAGTVIAAGGYLVFDEADFNSTSIGFALSGSNGDQVYLSQAFDGEFLGLQDAVEFGATFNGESLGRLPNGTGRLTRLAENSLGAANGVAEVGPLVISEVNYHPGTPNAAALALYPSLTDNDLEFIEIANPTASTIDLTDWRIRGEADYDFTVGTSLAAGAAIVIVSFDPTDPLNANKLAAFEAHYGLGSGTNIVGDLSASLSNSTGRISLQQPDAPDALGDIPHVVVDEVVYDDVAPWPDADGSGQSLQRDDFAASGSLVASWIADAPTPGFFEGQFLLGDINQDGVVNFLDISPFISRLQTGIFLAEADIDGNGLVNFLDISPFISLLSAQG